MTARSERIALAGLAALLIAAGLFLRVHGTLGDPLWLDEAYSAYAAAKGWAFLWHVVPRYETHPPFYYSLLRLWTLGVGDALPALRALGILCGMGTLAVIVAAGREIAVMIAAEASRRRLLATSLLALSALSPILIQMARQVRPYPVLILVYATALLAILRLMRRTASGRPVAGGAFALYLAMLAATLWLHTLGPLFAAALGLALAAAVLRRSLTRGDWTWLVLGHLVVGLIYLPALAIALDQAPTWVKSTWLVFSFNAIHWRLALLYGAPGVFGLPAMGVLFALALSALWPLPEGRRIAAALLVAMLLPVVSAILISVVVSPVFLVRTMSAAAVPSLLLLGVGALGLSSTWSRWLGVAAAAMLIVAMLIIDHSMYEHGPTQNWYGAVRWLAPLRRPDDLILAYPNEGALPFDRAVRDLHLDLPSRPIPMAVPALDVGGWNPTGSRGVVSLPRDRLRAIAAEPAVRGARIVWLLRLGANAYDKGDVFLDALLATRRPVARFTSGPIDIVGLRAGPGPSIPISRGGPASGDATR